MCNNILKGDSKNTNDDIKKKAVIKSQKYKTKIKKKSLGGVG